MECNSNDSSEVQSKINNDQVSGDECEGQKADTPYSPIDGTQLANANANENKILSHNCNGTVVFTSNPSNEAELQLYRVMQRASLLAYYDTLLEMGGDDVQQLCDAGEEEFLEIMVLVGMASKPLHVRRFQKALQEWLTNPGAFQTSLPNLVTRPLSVHNISSSPMSSTSYLSLTPSLSPSSTNLQQLGEISSCTPASTCSPRAESCSPVQGNTTLTDTQIYRLEEAARQLVLNLPQLEPKYQNAKKKVGKELEAVLQMSESDASRMTQIRKFSAIYGRFDCKRKPEKPLTLHELSVNEAAAQICRFIPALLTRRDELFPLARQVVRDSGYQYSKGHSKSCAINAYSRRITRSYSGEQTTNTNSNSNSNTNILLNYDELQENVKDINSKLKNKEKEIENVSRELEKTHENTSEHSALKHQLDVLRSYQSKLVYQKSNVINSAVIHRKGRKRRSSQIASSFVDSDRQDTTDECDSLFSYSNASSPFQDVAESVEFSIDDRDPTDMKHNNNTSFQGNFCNDERDKLTRGEDELNAYGFADSDNKLQVIASKGDNIIAVTNPALMMSAGVSRTVIKKEPLSPTKFK